MAEEGALAERALTTAWDAFEERFSWEDVSDLRLLGRLCLCSRALATVNAVRGPSPLLGRLAPAEEEVHFAVFFDLRTVFRRLLQDEMGVQAVIERDAADEYNPDSDDAASFWSDSD